MTGFLWRKIRNNKWLMFCMLIGNVLLIGIVTGTQMFTSATMQRILQEDLRRVQYSQNTFPAVMQMRYIFNAVNEPYRYITYRTTRDFWWPEVVEEMGIPTMFTIRTYIMTGWEAAPYEHRELPNRARRFSLAGVEGFEEQVEILHGRLPSDVMVDGNIIEVMATETAMHSLNLILDELMLVRNGAASSDEAEADIQPMFIRVVGVYTLAEGSGAFWSVIPINFNNMFLVSDRLVYERFVQNYRFEYRISVTWVEVLDFTAMRARDVPYYLRTANITAVRFNHSDLVWTFGINFYHTIQRHVERTDRLGVTLWVLQLPIYVMLALYMYMVSRQVLLIDKNDISVLQSRGAGSAQIFGLYTMQGLFVGTVSFPLGLGLGVLLCHALGASNGFLDMVQRTALEVEITSSALIFGGIAAAFSFFTMLVPVIGFSKVTIIDHKRTRSQKLLKPLWQRYFLDVLFLGAAIYVLFVFTNQQDLIVAEEAGAVDPLLYASSSLFIIGAGLLCLRMFPYFVKLVFVVGRRFFSPALYASMIKIMRSAGEEQFIMLFLVFTVAVGLFSAQAARTINLNNAHRIQYLAGADLVFREVWSDNVPDPAMPSPAPDMLVYTAPDFNRFTHFDEVDALTRVMRRDGSLHAAGSMVNNLQIMGIDTRSFGETIWFRDDLLRIHINYFLNLLAAQPDGVLLSDNFRTGLGYRVGDIVTITETVRLGSPASGRFVVLGFVDYWPSFAPVVRTRLATGEVRITEPYLAVVNLGQIQTHWGMRPYQVWMRTNGTDAQFFHDFINENRVRVAEFYDTGSALVEIRSDPIVQGTNGILTVNFIMILLVCFTGFLIYWILSIRSRVLQFGVFRAMGMSMGGIIGLLVNEQILVTLTALLIGGIVGEVAAQLFVPLIQLSYTAADQVIPLLVVMEARDYGNLYGMLGVMVMLCLIVLAGYVSRIRVAQALKLGED